MSLEKEIGELRAKSDSHQSWLEDLDKIVREQGLKLSSIESAVTNHLPTAIKDLRTMFWWLLTLVAGSVFVGHFWK